MSFDTGVTEASFSQFLEYFSCFTSHVYMRFHLSENLNFFFFFRSKSRPWTPWWLSYHPLSLNSESIFWIVNLISLLLVLISVLWTGCLSVCTAINALRQGLNITRQKHIQRLHSIGSLVFTALIMSKQETSKRKRSKETGYKRRKITEYLHYFKWYFVLTLFSYFCYKAGDNYWYFLCSDKNNEPCYLKVICY